MKGYDSHFLVPALNTYGYNPCDNDITEGQMRHEVSNKITCIPSNEEKYISFSKHIKVGEYTDKTGNKKPIMFEIRFLDTLAFLPSSIENLTSNLKSGSTDVNELRKIFKNTSSHFENDNEFLLMTEKGIYPYEYITSYNVLNEPNLPPIKNFYSKLAGKGCSEKDYNKALTIWETFGCQSILDYHNLYLTTDVLLLADIWENFRKVCYKIYQ